jgi:hypothetical protein
MEHTAKGDGGHQRMSTTFSKQDHEWLRNYAHDHRLSMNAVLSMALQKFIREAEGVGRER